MADIITQIRKIIANNIVYYRMQKSWSQEHLAELLETTPGYISELEHAKRNISVDYLELIANIFQVELTELLITRPPVKIRRIRKKHKR